MARVILLNSSVFLLSGEHKLPTTSFVRASTVCHAARQISVDEANDGGGTRSFGRLKVQRVRNIVNESYRKKIDLEDEDGKPEVAPSYLPVDSYDEPDELHDRRSSGTRKYVRRDVERDDYSARRRASSSRGNTGSSRGWGSVESTDSYRPREDDVSAKWKDVKVNSDFFSKKSFKELGCSDYIVESLKKLQYLQPSNIQAMAFTPVIEGKTCIMADQSGSGKTLAYLVPLVQRLRQEELEGLGRPASQKPRVVILVPTAELGSQVLSNCRSLSKGGVPFRSMVATGGFRQKTQLESLRQDLDVLIATPGRFMFLVKEGFLELTDLKSAVLDEVDILFKDEEFEVAFQTLVNSAPVTTQYLFATATLPVEIYNKLVENFPDCEAVMGPGMHRTSNGLEEVLVDCSGDERTERSPETAFVNKKDALLKLVEQSPVTKTIVFCNKIETCRKVENVLKRFDRKGISAKVLPFHAALDQTARLANIEEFRRFPPKNVSMFLICTDRASRGIDFIGVDHVLLFDFPRDPSEYVRRVGRTARGAGGKGKAFVFAVGKQVSLARRIIERNRKGHPLHDVPSAYEMMR